MEIHLLKEHVVFVDNDRSALVLTQTKCCD